MVRVRLGQLLAVGLLLFVALTSADSLDLTSGSVYSAILETRGLSNHWSGLLLISDSSGTEASPLPLFQYTFATPRIDEIANRSEQALADEGYWYAAMLLQESFTTSNIENITPEDLEANSLFNSTDFSTFYPQYENRTDNPNATFCCTNESVLVAGRNFTAYRITLNDSVPYYLLKYNSSGIVTPLFLAEVSDQSCYNGTSCSGLFMLPITTEAYSFYVLPEKTSYNITTWIDGVLSTNFNHTALPYNLTIEVRDLFDPTLLVPNLDVAVYEQGGQNLFVPLELSGIINTAWSLGQTDANGREEWLVAPTAYPDVDSYTIGVGAVEDGVLNGPKILSVDTYDTAPYWAKAPVDTDLRDDAVITVNALNSVVNFLFEWASGREEALQYRFDYENTTGNWTSYFYVTGFGYISGNVLIKTGAPNLIEARYLVGGTPTNASVRVRETDGLLILNPRTGSAPMSAKTRQHFQSIPAETQFVVTPTSYPPASSNVTLDLYNSGGALLDTLTININSTLNIAGGGATYSDDDLKVMVNSMNSVINSLFIALNS